MIKEVAKFVCPNALCTLFDREVERSIVLTNVKPDKHGRPDLTTGDFTPQFIVCIKCATVMRMTTLPRDKVTFI